MPDFFKQCMNNTQYDVAENPMDSTMGQFGVCLVRESLNTLSPYLMALFILVLAGVLRALQPDPQPAIRPR